MNLISSVWKLRAALPVIAIAVFASIGNTDIVSEVVGSLSPSSMGVCKGVEGSVRAIFGSSAAAVYVLSIV